MLSPDQLANPKYSILYLPTFTFLYLWTIPEPGQFTILTIPIINTELYPLFAGIALVGAVLAQNFFEAIYGPGGPEENPKYTTTSLKHMFAIAMNIEADRISESKMVNIGSAIREIGRSVPLLKAIRGLTIISIVYALRLLMFYSIILVVYYLWVGQGNFALALLFLGLTIIFIQKYVSKLFPDTGSLESAEYLDTPEYKRFENRINDS